MSLRSREGAEVARIAELEGLADRMKKQNARIFEEMDEPQARRERMLADFDPVLAVMKDQNVAEHIRAEIERASALTDKELFVATIAMAIRPLLDEYLQSPAQFEQVAREHWRHESNFESLSKILKYGRSGDKVHVHLAIARALGPGEQIRSVREGLQRLAEIVEKDETIKQVTATSWIVAARPGLLEKLGFTIEADNLSEVEMKEHFADENRPVRRATMTRGVLLERYLKK